MTSGTGFIVGLPSTGADVVGMEVDRGRLVGLIRGARVRGARVRGALVGW